MPCSQGDSGARLTPSTDMARTVIDHMGLPCWIYSRPGYRKSKRTLMLCDNPVSLYGF